MSFDAGRKWKALVRNSSHEEIKDFALAPGGKMYYAVATGVYLSTDSGNAWKKMPVDGSGCAINTFVLNSDSSLVIGSDRLGVILQ